MTEYKINPDTFDDPITTKPGDVLIFAPGIYTNENSTMEIFGETKVVIPERLDNNLKV